MIALDGRFYRADLDGAINEIEPGALTPFAVVVWFEPEIEFELDGPLDHDASSPPSTGGCRRGELVRGQVDGEFDPVRARSVPRQRNCPTVRSAR